MNRAKAAHAVSVFVKGISLITGLASLIHFLPPEYAVIAAVVFGVMSWAKDLASSLETKLESTEPLIDVAIDTVKEAEPGVESAVKAASTKSK